jgi:O-antigen/teichoic acid export membrane protein
VLAAGDRLLVERILGLDAAGRYQIAYLVGALGLTALQAINNAWAPMVHRAAEAERWNLLADTTAVVYEIGALLAALIAIGGPVALSVLAPSSYDLTALSPVTAVVAMCALANVMYLSSAHIAFQKKRTAILAWSTPVAALVNIALNLVLLRIWGLTGGAVATLVGYVLWAGLVRRAASRLQAVPWKRDVEVRCWWTGAALATVGAVAPAEGGWLAVRVVGAAAVVGVLVVRARRLTVLPSSPPAHATVGVPVVGPA